jgi:hypothetical protein
MAFIIADLVIDHDKAPPSLRWDHDRGVCGTGTSSSSGKTVITGPCGTSSPGMTTMGGGVVMRLEHPLPLVGPR